MHDGPFITSQRTQQIAWVPRGAAPWSAVILRRTGTLASGALIHPSWVLTSAHAGVQPYEQVMVGGSDVRLRDGNICTVLAVFPHPDFDDKHHRADLALLRIHQPLPVPRLAIASEVSLGTNGAFYGWGETSAAEVNSGDLRKIDVTIEKISDHDEQIWTTTALQEISYGDSGAPLVMTSAQGPVAAAVLCCQLNPALGTDLSIGLLPYRSWIEQIIAMYDQVAGSVAGVTEG